MKTLEYNRLFSYPAAPYYEWHIYRVNDLVPFGGHVGYVRKLREGKWVAYTSRHAIERDRHSRPYRTRREAADYLVRVADNNAVGSLTGHWTPLPEDRHNHGT